MKNEKKKIIAAVALITVITASIIALTSCNDTRDDTHLESKTETTTTTAPTTMETTEAVSTEPIVTTTEEIATTIVETTEPTEVTTEATEPTEPTTEPKPQPTEPKPTEPKPTEPKPTEPKPQPTEPKPTEPKPTEPKPQPTEPEPTEPEPTNPPASYNTSWGTRPYEFQEVGHYEMWEGYVCHYDRYGNTWWDRTNGYSSASGKYIYKGSIASYPCVRYYGNGRWTGNGYYWDQEGNTGGSYSYGCYQSYSSWGSSYTEYWLPSDMPDDYNNWLDVINVYANYPDYKTFGIPSELPDGTVVTDEMYESAVNGGLKTPYSPYIGR